MKRQLHEPAAEERGALLEGWIHGLLRARHAYAGLYGELTSWAPTQGGTEVDFLIRRGKSFVAVEVKTTANPASPDFAGLRAIADLTGVRRRVLVHMGGRAFDTPEGIEDPGRSPGRSADPHERNDDDDLLASMARLARP